MNTDVQFCTTADGVTIAYTAMGNGPPLVQVLGWTTHLELYETLPDFATSIWGLLARHRTFYAYDGRGFGLSDRGIRDFNLDAKVSDLEAVVNAAGLDKFDIFGTSEGGPTAMAFANRHPGRVKHLTLLGTFARTVRPETPEALAEAQLRIMAIKPGWGKDTPEYRQLWTMQFIPDSTQEEYRWFNELQRRSADADTVLAMMADLIKIDVRKEAKQIKVPTLVIHARGDSAVPFERGREVAALIPGAKFLSVDSSNHVPLASQPATRQIADAIEQFLADSDHARATVPAAPSGLVTILFTDIVSSTALTQALGDAHAQDLVRRHNSAVRDALKAHNGTEIKHTGDGIMASFPVASGALAAAVAVQRRLAEENASAETPVTVRIGLSAGEPLAEEGDLYGATVQLAARVCDKAAAGQIVVSNVVRELAMGKGFAFADLGDFVPKGFEDAVHVYEVSWA
ncbi:MAG TPA: adenylate/guanylate cyclase domain-containing protein [Dehalococcoidia bacterium]|nr:adenylate/guanylate cyclase domain-containing protein [Dehalococcoidia bacterium]